MNQGLKKRKQDTNDDVTTEMEQLKKRAYKALSKLYQKSMDLKAKINPSHI